jgi:hypothetical protein
VLAKHLPQVSQSNYFAKMRVLIKKTQESIAELSKRPLYILGKQDFVASPSDKSLAAALARASKWNSIVLLDEADVFMQERSASEMFRNEQVSGKLLHLPSITN